MGGLWQPFSWVLAFMQQPALQRTPTLLDEYLGPVGRGSLLSLPQAGLQGLLLTQKGPRHPISQRLVWGPFARCSAPTHQLQHSPHAGALRKPWPALQQEARHQGQQGPQGGRW